jgi:hypothetical protein
MMLPADPTHMNDARAEWANEALRVFARRTGLALPEDAYEAVSDLIADLRHWWDRHGNEDSTWCDVLRTATSHYYYETDPENESAE